MNEHYSIVYVGTLRAGGTSLQRCRALEDLGHTVWPVDTVGAQEQQRLWFFLSRSSYKLFRLGLDRFSPFDLTQANARLVETVRSRPVDLVWLDKAHTIAPRTLRRVRELRPTCRLIGYSPDDMNARHNQSGRWLRGLPLYHMYFTTKSYGVAELQALGGRRVHFVGNAYDPQTHKPVAIPEDEKTLLGGPVGFIGTFEQARYQSILYLAEKGIGIRWYGSAWDGYRNTSSNLHVENRHFHGAGYARAICAFDINLCFLRKINRDLQTTRTIEIPACGAFMLAERTEEHLDLFTEGKEAEFFGSDEELLDKVRYYLAHPDERRRIAAAGRERCLRSGYSNHDRLRWMLEKVAEVTP